MVEFAGGGFVNKGTTSSSLLYKTKHFFLFDLQIMHRHSCHSTDKTKTKSIIRTLGRVFKIVKGKQKMKNPYS